MNRKHLLFIFGVTCAVAYIDSLKTKNEALKGQIDILVKQINDLKTVKGD